ncbi:hypothetical protein KFU94_09105 [Chloroflexi bacterium TSY]|nr:hypothetical protein [Chloroflexi bacterium TSY]
MSKLYEILRWTSPPWELFELIGYCEQYNTLSPEVIEWRDKWLAIRGNESLPILDDYQEHDKPAVIRIPLNGDEPALSIDADKAKELRKLAAWNTMRKAVAV